MQTNNKYYMLNRVLLLTSLILFSLLLTAYAPEWSIRGKVGEDVWEGWNEVNYKNR